jgi:type I restriction enzyme R subunit
MPFYHSFKQKSKKEKIEFKKTLKRYQNIYAFLSQLIPFSDVNLEKMYIFNKFLNKKLPTINNPLPFSVLQDVDIDSYKIVNKGKEEIYLTSSGELNPISSIVSEAGQDYNEPLSEQNLPRIIKFFLAGLRIIFWRMKN